MDIRTWRQSEGLSIREAAERCGVNPRSWESWEFRGNLPSLEAAHKIIEGSKGAVTLNDLVKKSTGV